MICYAYQAPQREVTSYQQNTGSRYMRPWVAETCNTDRPKRSGRTCQSSVLSTHPSRDQSHFAVFLEEIGGWEPNHRGASYLLSDTRLRALREPRCAPRPYNESRGVHGCADLEQHVVGQVVGRERPSAVLTASALPSKGVC